MTEGTVAVSNEGATGVGAALAQAREELGLALADVAQQLKFAPRQLEALEQERFDLLPAGTFVRGMVRNYARLLKVDAEPLIARLGRNEATLDSNRLAERYKQPVPFSDSARRSTFVYLGVSLGVLTAVGAVAYQWYHEHQAMRPTVAKAPQHKATPTPPPPVVVAAKPEPAEPEPAPRPVSAPAQPPAPKPQPVVAKAEEKSTKEIIAVRDKTVAEKTAEVLAKPIAPGVHRIVLRCEEEAWLEVKDAAGRQLLSSLNPAGCERVVQGRGPFEVVIGNASHVRVLHNDRPVNLQPHTKQDIARFTIP